MFGCHNGKSSGPPRWAFWVFPLGGRSHFLCLTGNIIIVIRSVCVCVYACRRALSIYYACHPYNVKGTDARAFDRNRCSSAIPGRSHTCVRVCACALKSQSEGAEPIGKRWQTSQRSRRHIVPTATTSSSNQKVNTVRRPFLCMFARARTPQCRELHEIFARAPGHENNFLSRFAEARAGRF